MTSFMDLLAIHRELDADFAQHQYALLHFEFDRAADLLGTYRKKLLAHMEYEENTLLPVYVESALIERGGEAKLFLDEHEKMRNLLDLFLDALNELGSADPPEPLLIRLLDREFFYLKLCSHHDNREAKFLYPALDAITDERWRGELLDARA